MGLVGLQVRELQSIWLQTKRIAIVPNTRYMIHQPAGGVQGQSTEIQIEAKEILRMRKRVNKLIAKATGQTLEQIEKDTDRNFWLSAEEAKDYGIVGKIIESDSAVK